jgi:hypothetical protein
LIAALMVAASPTLSLAGEGDNIMACIQAVQAFDGRTVDEFDARYEGRLLDLSEVKWPGIDCAVKLGLVFDLTVDGRQLIVDHFAGQQAKSTYERLEVSTDEAISLLESRIQILERRLADAETKLKQPNPDIKAVAAHVDSGIAKATGN